MTKHARSKQTARTSVESLQGLQPSKDEETTRLVNEALDKKSYTNLRRLSCVRGLVHHSLRQRAWPVLSGATLLEGSYPSVSKADYDFWASVQHRDRNVVRVDVERSLFNLMDGCTDDELNNRRQQLERLLNAVVGQHCVLPGMTSGHDNRSTGASLLSSTSEDLLFQPSKKSKHKKKKKDKKQQMQEQEAGAQNPFVGEWLKTPIQSTGGASVVGGHSDGGATVIMTVDSQTPGGIFMDGREASAPYSTGRTSYGSLDAAPQVLRHSPASSSFSAPSSRRATSANGSAAATPARRRTGLSCLGAPQTRSPDSSCDNLPLPGKKQQEQSPASGFCMGISCLGGAVPGDFLDGPYARPITPSVEIDSDSLFASDSGREQDMSSAQSHRRLPSGGAVDSPHSTRLSLLKEAIGAASVTQQRYPSVSRFCVGSVLGSSGPSMTAPLSRKMLAQDSTVTLVLDEKGQDELPQHAGHSMSEHSAARPHQDHSAHRRAVSHGPLGQAECEGPSLARGSMGATQFAPITSHFTVPASVLARQSQDQQQQQAHAQHAQQQQHVKAGHFRSESAGYATGNVSACPASPAPPLAAISNPLEAGAVGNASGQAFTEPRCSSQELGHSSRQASLRSRSGKHDSILDQISSLNLGQQEHSEPHRSSHHQQHTQRHSFDCQGPAAQPHSGRLHVVHTQQESGGTSELLECGSLPGSMPDDDTYHQPSSGMSSSGRCFERVTSRSSRARSRGGSFETEEPHVSASQPGDGGMSRLNAAPPHVRAISDADDMLVSSSSCPQWGSDVEKPLTKRASLAAAVPITQSGPLQRHSHQRYVQPGKAEPQQGPQLPTAHPSSPHATKDNAWVSFDEDAHAHHTHEGLPAHQSQPQDPCLALLGDEIEAALDASTAAPSPEESSVDPALVPVSQNAYYYQGLHDIASVLLLVTGSEQAAFPILSRLVTCQLRDATKESIKPVEEMMQFLYPLLRTIDPELAAHLQAADLPPYFALSWIITWFSHDIKDLQVAARLFDLFLSSHPIMPLYVGITAMRDIRQHLLQCEEFPQLHTALQHLKLSNYVGSAASAPSRRTLSATQQRRSGLNSPGSPSNSAAAGHSTSFNAVRTSGGLTRRGGGGGGGSASGFASGWSCLPVSQPIDALICDALQLYKEHKPAVVLRRSSVLLMHCVQPVAELVKDVWTVPLKPPHAGRANRDDDTGMQRLLRFIRQLGKGRVNPSDGAQASLVDSDINTPAFQQQQQQSRLKALFSAGVVTVSLVATVLVSWASNNSGRDMDEHVRLYAMPGM